MQLSLNDYLLPEERLPALADEHKPARIKPARWKPAQSLLLTAPTITSSIASHDAVNAAVAEYLSLDMELAQSRLVAQSVKWSTQVSHLVEKPARFALAKSGVKTERVENWGRVYACAPKGSAMRELLPKELQSLRPKKLSRRHFKVPLKKAKRDHYIIELARPTGPFYVAVSALRINESNCDKLILHPASGEFGAESVSPVVAVLLDRRQAADEARQHPGMQRQLEVIDALPAETTDKFDVAGERWDKRRDLKAEDIPGRIIETLKAGPCSFEGYCGKHPGWFSSAQLLLKVSGIIEWDWEARNYRLLDASRPYFQPGACLAPSCHGTLKSAGLALWICDADKGHLAVPHIDHFKEQHAFGMALRFSVGTKQTFLPLSDFRDAPVRVLQQPEPSKPLSPAAVALVACCGKKKALPMPAGEMYCSDLFKKSKAYAELVCGSWFILSAKYGLVDPAHELECYNLSLDDLTQAQRLVWSEQVARDIQAAVPVGTLLVLLAGGKYVAQLMPLLEQAGYSIAQPLKGKAIGQQKQWLKAQLESSLEPKAPAPYGPKQLDASESKASVPTPSFLAEPVDATQPAESAPDELSDATVSATILGLYQGRGYRLMLPVASLVRTLQGGSHTLVQTSAEQIWRVIHQLEAEGQIVKEGDPPAYTLAQPEKPKRQRKAKSADSEPVVHTGPDSIPCEVCWQMGEFESRAMRGQSGRRYACNERGGQHWCWVEGEVLAWQGWETGLPAGWCADVFMKTWVLPDGKKMPFDIHAAKDRTFQFLSRHELPNLSDRALGLSCKYCAESGVYSEMKRKTDNEGSWRCSRDDKHRYSALNGGYWICVTDTGLPIVEGAESSGPEMAEKFLESNQSICRFCDSDMVRLSSDSWQCQGDRAHRFWIMRGAQTVGVWSDEQKRQEIPVSKTLPLWAQVKNDFMR
ncbi:MAG: DUF6884 domain-containing protein [Candidatus Sericytochromatia bacterium]